MVDWRVVACALCVWTLTLMSVGAVVPLPDGARRTVREDTLQQRTSSRDLRSDRRMSTSAYPVKIEVHGRAVMIHSDHVQLLPIYTRGGVLKMTLRLNKGTNWLNGLPRGNYFINNRPVAIK